MEFEWDKKKAKSNETKHGISFHEAGTVFGDPLALTFDDPDNSFAIEHTVPIHSGIDYDKVFKSEDQTLTQFGLPISEVKGCPQPFFTMQINPDGKVVPCFSFEYPEIMGDCNHEAANKIWTS